jgi:hypothetical protein
MLKLQNQYQVFRSDRVDGIHGGVLALVHNSIDVSSVKRFSHYALVETLWIKIHLRKTTIQVGLVYRSPSSNDISDLVLSLEIDHQLSQFSGDSIVVGDFNFPGLYTSTGFNLNYSNRSDVANTFVDLGLVQKVTEPTRSQNILDLVLTNDSQLVTNTSVSQKFGSSDHFRITFSINIPDISSNSTCSAPGFNFSRGDYSRMSDFLSSVNWYALFLEAVDTNEMWCIFRDFLIYAVNMYVPKKTRKESYKIHWSAATRSLYRRKTELWRKFKESKILADRVAHAGDLAKAYEDVTNAAKAYDDVAKAASVSASADVKVAEESVLSSKNIKRFYSYINSQLSSRNLIPPLKNPNTGELVFDSHKKVDLFQDQFSSVFTQDDGILPHFDYRTDAKLEYINITEEAVLRRLVALPNKVSSGPDEIPALVLKNVAVSISSPLTSIFSRSLETGEVPYDWLSANVTPIFKNKAQNDDPSNYRPISLGSVPSRVMESIVKEQVESFLHTHRLISNKQHGFVKGKSTVTNVLSTMNTWMKSHLKGRSTYVCYIDFANNFA